MQVLPHLSGIFSFSLDKGCGLKIVVPAGPKGALKERATLDSCLDPGQREVFWEQHLTTGDLILEKWQQEKNDCQQKSSNHQQKASLQHVHRCLFYLIIFRQGQTIHQLRVGYETFDVLIT